MREFFSKITEGHRDISAERRIATGVSTALLVIGVAALALLGGKEAAGIVFGAMSITSPLVYFGLAHLLKKYDTTQKKYSKTDYSPDAIEYRQKLKNKLEIDQVIQNTINQNKDKKSVSKNELSSQTSSTPQKADTLQEKDIAIRNAIAKVDGRINGFATADLRKRMDWSGITEDLKERNKAHSKMDYDPQLKGAIESQNKRIIDAALDFAKEQKNDDYALSHKEIEEMSEFILAANPRAAILFANTLETSF